MPWPNPTTLHDPALTPTIRLEPLTTHHAKDLFAAADPELFRHSMQNPPEWSVRGFEIELDKVISTPGVLAFAIILNSPCPTNTRDAARDTSRFRPSSAIGRTTFMDIQPAHRGLEIGRTWIARPFHGTRVNPEAKFLMLRHAFEELAPTAIRVQITTNGTNLHSQRAIEKLGATREGVLRHSRIMQPFPKCPGRETELTRDWVIYSILAAEWPAAKQRLLTRLHATP
jgi:N-acetyltransferase